MGSTAADPTEQQTPVRYELLRNGPFDEGAFGKVHLVRAKAGPFAERVMVEKRVEASLEKDDDGQETDAEREALFLSALARLNLHPDRLNLLCPYLVEAFDHVQTGTKHRLYTEVLPGGNLYLLSQHFHEITRSGRECWRPGGRELVWWNKPNWLDEPYWLFYIWQVVEALEYMHMLGYVHGDIKPENVMLDWYGNVKVGDGWKGGE